MNTTQKLTWEQTDRLYRTLLELLADQYGVDVNILSIRPAETGEKSKIIWRNCNGEHQETAS